MNVYEFENKIISKLVKNEEIDEAIKLTEQELLKIPKNDFHKVIGRNLLDLVNNTNDFLKTVYQKAVEEINDVKLIYCETSGFTINRDLWFVTGSSFSLYNELTDTERLDHYDSVLVMELVINGYEDLNKSYEDYIKNEKWDLEESADLCEIIIKLRIFELFRKTHEVFLNKSEWTKIPLFVNSHNSELMFKIK